MSPPLPPAQHGAVLTGLKATPSGWPPASLDPACGRLPTAATGPERSDNFRYLWLHEIAATAARLGRRRRGCVERSSASTPCSITRALPNHLACVGGQVDDALEPLTVRGVPDLLPVVTRLEARCGHEEAQA